MAAWRKMGVICINTDVQGVCQQCLWLEWNPAQKHCRNESTCLCPKRPGYQQEENHDLQNCATQSPTFRR